MGDGDGADGRWGDGDGVMGDGVTEMG